MNSSDVEQMLDEYERTNPIFHRYRQKFLDWYLTDNMVDQLWNMTGYKDNDEYDDNQWYNCKAQFTIFVTIAAQSFMAGHICAKQDD